MGENKLFSLSALETYCEELQKQQLCYIPVEFKGKSDSSGLAANLIPTLLGSDNLNGKSHNPKLKNPGGSMFVFFQSTSELC